jgi:hypothetical protein
MTSRQFTFSKRLSSIGVGDDTVRFAQSMQLSSSTKKKLQLKSGVLSSEIPNVFSYGSFNNGLVKMSRNAGVWTSIQLPNGIYSVSDIMQCINNTISSWYTSSADPAFQLINNASVSSNYIILDSTKLAVGGTQIGVDFSASSIYTLLGFVTTKSFITNGTHTASDRCVLDVFGNTCSIGVNGLGSISIVNSSISNVLATIDLSNATGNLYKISSDETIAVNITPPNEIAEYSITFTGSRGNQMVWLEGELSLTFELIEY